MPTNPEIRAKIERTDRDLVDGLGALGVATVHEANSRTGLMHHIHPVTGGVSIGGTALTCLNYAGDNLMLHAALDVAEPGDVLIVAVTAPSEHGMFGELLATSCRARGVTGVVLDAGARDTTQLREMRYPVWSRAISAAGTVKNSVGWVNIPVSCGGLVVFPGDVVVADDDGVAVVAREDAAEVLAKATAREEREEGLRRRFADGESSLDVSNLRPTLESALRRD